MTLKGFADFLARPDTLFQCVVVLVGLLGAVFAADIRNLFRASRPRKLKRLEKIKKRLTILHELHGNAYDVIMLFTDDILRPLSIFRWLVAAGVVLIVVKATVAPVSNVIIMACLLPGALIITHNVTEFVSILLDLLEINKNISKLATRGNALAAELGEQKLDEELCALVKDPHSVSERADVVIEEMKVLAERTRNLTNRLAESADEAKRNLKDQE